MEFADHLRRMIIEKIGQTAALVLLSTLGVIAWTVAAYLLRLVQHGCALFKVEDAHSMLWADVLPRTAHAREKASG